MSKNSFEHVADPDAFVALAREHLAPTGQLVIGSVLRRVPPLREYMSFGVHSVWRRPDDTEAAGS